MGGGQVGQKKKPAKRNYTSPSASLQKKINQRNVSVCEAGDNGFSSSSRDSASSRVNTGEPVNLESSVDSDFLFESL